MSAGHATRADAAPRKTQSGLAHRRVTSAELFEGRNEVVIEHGGRTYVLRLYANGSLSLHKQPDAPRRRTGVVRDTHRK